MTSVGFFNLPQEKIIEKTSRQLISAFTERSEAENEVIAIKKSENVPAYIRKGRIPGHKNSVFCVYA